MAAGRRGRSPAVEEDAREAGTGAVSEDRPADGDSGALHRSGRQRPILASWEREICPSGREVRRRCSRGGGEKQGETEDGNKDVPANPMSGF
jgi:hypothetical protein